MTNANKKRLVSNLLLLAIVGGLLIFILSRDENNAEQYKTLYDKSIGDNAKDVVIHVEGREDVVLENKDDTWQVIKPTKFLADKAKVQHLFTLLKENAESNYPIAGKDLAEYGLDKERLSISFNGVKYIFGKLNPVTQQRFIQKSDTLYLITETVSGVMQMGEEAFKPQPRADFKPATVNQ
ncbi:MAG: DUF4340 domain-containing protein [Cocleimonas sp.]